jgi:hypothetical protein
MAGLHTYFALYFKAALFAKAQIDLDLNFFASLLMILKTLNLLLFTIFQVGWRPFFLALFKILSEANLTCLQMVFFYFQDSSHLISDCLTTIMY